MSTVDIAVGLAVDVDEAEILEERARQMALPLEPPPSDGDLHLVVRTGGQRIALKMSALRGVVAPPPITSLRVDGFLCTGLVALSGEVVPVVDLAALLRLEKAAGDAEPMLVVVDDAGSPLALKVDRVEGHETLRPHLAARIDLSDSAAAGAPLATPVGADGLLVLDIDAALGDPRLSPEQPDTGLGVGMHR